MPRQEPGWANPQPSRKYHYFIDGRALCSGWLYFGQTEPDNGIATKHDCSICRRRLATKQGKETLLCP